MPLTWNYHKKLLIFLYFTAQFLFYYFLGLLFLNSNFFEKEYHSLTTVISIVGIFLTIYGLLKFKLLLLKSNHKWVELGFWKLSWNELKDSIWYIFITHLISVFFIINTLSIILYILIEDLSKPSLILIWVTNIPILFLYYLLCLKWIEKKSWLGTTYHEIWELFKSNLPGDDKELLDYNTNIILLGDLSTSRLSTIQLYSKINQYEKWNSSAYTNDSDWPIYFDGINTFHSVPTSILKQADEEISKQLTMFFSDAFKFNTNQIVKIISINQLDNLHNLEKQIIEFYRCFKRSSIHLNEIRICLYGLDEVVGYKEFLTFYQLRNEKVHMVTDQNNLFLDSIHNIENDLYRMLINLRSDEYLKCVEFLSQFGSLLHPLKAWFDRIQEETDFTKITLFLMTSNREVLSVSNPFYLTEAHNESK